MNEFKPTEDKCLKCVAGYHDECDHLSCTCDFCGADEYWKGSRRIPSVIGLS